MSEKESLIPPEREDLGVSVNVTPASPGFTTINCQICSAVISLEGKQSAHVVKCQQCGEATPIKSAPPGKRYVRCSCNCLLICQAAGRRVACPRENCRRVITLSSQAAGSSYGATGAHQQQQQQQQQQQLLQPGPGQLQCLCGHCGNAFLVTRPEMTPMAACNSCGRVSSIGPHFARTRWLGYLSGALVLLTALGFLAAFTWKDATHGRGGFFALYAVMLLISIVLLVRSLLFCRLKVSVVQSRGVAA